MTVGISASNLANRILDHLRGGTAWGQPSGLWVALHTGDPGVSGAANAAPTVAARSAATFGAASGGAFSLTGTNPVWSMSSGATVTHISVWDAVSGGNFLWSAPLSVAKTIDAGDSLTLNSCGLSFGPLSA